MAIYREFHHDFPWWFSIVRLYQRVDLPIIFPFSNGHWRTLHRTWTTELWHRSCGSTSQCGSKKGKGSMRKASDADVLGDVVVDCLLWDSDPWLSFSWLSWSLLFIAITIDHCGWVCCWLLSLSSMIVINYHHCRHDYCMIINWLICLRGVGIPPTSNNVLKSRLLPTPFW